MISHGRLFIALFALISIAPAQINLLCTTGDDGFNVGCCNIPQVNLPNIPGMSSTATHGCLQDCALEAQHDLTIQLGAPNFVVCDIALIPITISPAGPGAPGYSGTLFAKYSRTFMVVDAAGVGHQTWRFIVNGELARMPGAGVAPCPIPASASATGGSVHWWGSIDYQCRNISTPPFPPFAQWRYRLDLTHAPGCLQHGPWSAYPLTGAAAHNDRSFHVVAPGNFTFAPVPEPQGATDTEAVRSSRFDPATGYACLGEAPVVPGPASGLFTQSQNCLCSPMLTAPSLWKHQYLGGVVQCAGALVPFSAVPLQGTPFPTGFVSLTLGFWNTTGGGHFSTGMELVVHWGVLQYQSVCAMNFQYHIVSGVSTTGVPVSIFGGVATPPVYNTATDLANHLSFNFAPGFALPTFGNTAWSDTVWNLNF